MGDFNAEPRSETYKHLLSAGFRSSYVSANGNEPPITFPTGLKAPHMDTDPPMTLDYIFYRVGHGSDTDTHIKVLGSKRMGDRKDENDPTILGSDHFPIATDFEIYPPRV
jgi:endonuclease/exonuclease/phosphatase (EEP) superfamily protein YafD